VDRPSPSFLSNEVVGQEDQTHLEAQQALLVELLRRAGAEAVSYAELRDRGIDLPASVVSELELAGFPIERCYVGSGSRQLGVRLDPARDPLRPFAEQPVETAIAAVAEPVRSDYRRPIEIRWRRETRALAPIAVLLLAIAVIVLAVTALGPSGPGKRPVAHRVPARALPLKKSAAPVIQAAAAPTPPSTPVSPELATQLESQGHGLLASGNYSGAVPTLRRAVAATGEQAGECLQPVSENCLTYAYALYDLGRALRLSGDPAAAVPVLQQRLEIDNQRPVVQAELALAQTAQSR
jgi:hypothetical protein